MKNKLGLMLMLVVSFGLLAGCQSRSKVTPQTNSVDTKLVANSAPVTKVKIGETYVAYKKTKSEYRWFLVKLVDKTHMLYVLDAAHNPVNYYIHSLDDGGSDEKQIDIYESTYQKQAGKTIYPSKTVRWINLGFDPTTSVKRGSSGNYLLSQYPEYDYKNNGVLFWKNGRYVKAEYNGKGPITNWYVSKIKLPDTAEAYMAQYKLTKLHLYGE